MFQRFGLVDNQRERAARGQPLQDAREVGLITVVFALVIVAAVKVELLFRAGDGLTRLLARYAINQDAAFDFDLADTGYWLPSTALPAARVRKPK